MSRSNSESHLHGRRSFLTGAVAAVGAATATHVLPPAVQGKDEPQKRTPAVDGLEGIKTLLAGKDPVMWVITGDSITHGALHTLGWRSYPEHFAERVRWELRRVRDIVINTGISGDIDEPTTVIAVKVIASKVVSNVEVWITVVVVVFP